MEPEVELLLERRAEVVNRFVDFAEFLAPLLGAQTTHVSRQVSEVLLAVFGGFVVPSNPREHRVLVQVGIGPATENIQSHEIIEIGYFTVHPFPHYVALFEQLTRWYYLCWKQIRVEIGGARSLLHPTQALCQIDHPGRLIQERKQQNLSIFKLEFKCIILEQKLLECNTFQIHNPPLPNQRLIIPQLLLNEHQVQMFSRRLITKLDFTLRHPHIATPQTELPIPQNIVKEELFGDGRDFLLRGTDYPVDEFLFYELKA